MKMKAAFVVASVLLMVTAGVSTAWSEVCNVKVVTDASPDYSDMESMIHSITANWPSPEEKCWALFYWNHIARRQTTPMILHGLECTDPIRQFNDYGYTMCSTIAGINCSIWDAMGCPIKFWDISHAHRAGGGVRRPLAHVRQLHVGPLHALRRQDDRRRRGHRQGGRLRGLRREAWSRATSPSTTASTHRPQRLPHRRRTVPATSPRSTAASTPTA